MVNFTIYLILSLIDGGKALGPYLLGLLGGGVDGGSEVICSIAMGVGESFGSIAGLVVWLIMGSLLNNQVFGRYLQHSVVLSEARLGSVKGSYI